MNEAFRSDQSSTFRRFENGKTAVGMGRSDDQDLPGRPHLQVPDLRSPHAALPGQLPVGARHSRLARHRPRHGQAAGRRHAVAAIRLQPHGRGQSVSRPSWAASARRPARTAATATRSTISSASTRSSNMSATGRSRTSSPLPTAPALTGKRVAVVGGGPAGLSAAHFLRNKGHAVTIFEAHDKLGGMMRFGIPGYRTPRDMLDAEIGRILALGGVEVRCGVKVGRDVSIDDLERDFDAIFWAIGAQKGRPLPVPGADAENCITGVEFLDSFNRGWVFSTAKRIIVVGGGDTSIDVASVARRLGHVTHSGAHDVATNEEFGHTASDVAGALSREGVHAVLTSLFPVEKMTAAEREREDAVREGIEIIGGVMPLEVIKDENGLAVALRICNCTMKGMSPHPGRRAREFEIECDMIISAIGQMADLAEGLERLDSGRGAIAIDPVYQVKEDAEAFRRRRRHPAAPADDRDRPRPHRRRDDHRLPRTANSASGGRRSTSHQFNLLAELHERHLDPAPYDHRQERGTDGNVRGPQLRGSRRDARSFRTPRCSRATSTMSRAAERDERHVHARRGARRFRGAHRRLHRGAGAQGGRALHELRPVLRMRQLRDLLPADRGLSACRRRSARSGATSRPITRSASAATSAWTSAPPATSRWASGSSRWRALANPLALAALFAGAAALAPAARRRRRGRGRRCPSSRGARATIACATPPSCAATT